MCLERVAGADLRLAVSLFQGAFRYAWPVLRINLRIHPQISGPGLIQAAASHGSAELSRPLVARQAVRFLVSAFALRLRCVSFHAAADLKAAAVCGEVQL